MKKNLQLILSLLCILALAFGITAAAAEEMEARVITVVWEDGDNFDGLRGDLTAKLGDQSVTLTAANGWTGAVEVPVGAEAGWSIDTPEGYVLAIQKTENGITTVKYNRRVPDTVDVQAQIKWDDNSDAEKIRPKAVQIMLYADGQPYGEPQSGNASVKWTGLPYRNPGKTEKITYTVKALKDPDGYTSSVSDNTVTFKLNTVDVTINVTIAGAPAGPATVSFDTARFTACFADALWHM